MSANLKIKEPNTFETEKPNSANLRIVSRGVLPNLSEIMLQGVKDGAYPGITVLVTKEGKEIFKSAVGFRSVKLDEADEPLAMRADTIFDIGQLTQQFVTTTLIMLLVEKGSIRLEDLVSRHIQCFGVNGKSKITIRHLLSHSSGLSANMPFFEELELQNSTKRIGILGSRGARDYIFNSITRSQVKYQTGNRELYSEINFLVLGQLIEALTGLDLGKASEKYIFRPLGLKNSSYIDLSLLKSRGLKPVTDLIAPTENCTWRKKLLCGEVQDENAWAMGGIAGHAGVFSNIDDLSIFSVELLKAFYGKSNFLKAQTIREFWQRNQIFDDNNLLETYFSLGWQKASEPNDSLLSKDAIGFNSNNGCSLWIDPRKAVTIVILNNSFHPSKTNKKFKEVRSQILSYINESLSPR
jgi:CubicO group peptidase (beta-lactamase class C family)